MIEIATILSAIVHHWEDFWIIFVLLVLNAVVGFWEEHKADNAIELLKQGLAPKARALRDGTWLELDAREPVTGDVVHVRLGVIVPADLKLFEGDYILTDESALAGKSLTVEKHPSDVAYTGSIILYRYARLLSGAVLETPCTGTLIAVYGIFMSPIGWVWALFVWGYAIAWLLFLMNRVKLAAYRIFDSQRAVFWPRQTRDKTY
jgi:P-type E1-E2 ATPase